MADISQVKLPNGDTYNLVDETSGYSKVHIVDYDEDNDTIGTSYNQLRSWVDADEIVILKGESDYYRLNGRDENTLYFGIADGYFVHITSSSITHSGEGWLTLSTLPIYDGTVV